MTLMSSREWADGAVKCMNACLCYFQYVLDLWRQLCFNFHSTAPCGFNQVITSSWDSGEAESYVSVCECFFRSLCSVFS